VYSKEALEWDGSLRDLYILNTTVDDWQSLIDFLLQSEYPNTYTVNGEIAEFPSRVERVFETRNKATTLLSVRVDKVMLNCHFFCEEEIEFDLDPREITDKAHLRRLFEFMKRVGQVVGKDVLLTLENAEFPLYRFNQISGKVEAIHSQTSTTE
jgi:hypothetical protein